jgi:RNA ligase (TIGR02306 family)
MDMKDEMKEWQDMALQAMSEDDVPEYDSAGFTENDRFVNEQNSVIMTDRKLASIRTITDIQPIDGADAIEVAVVGGWKVVTKKGEYKPGDLCVYCEVDSFLPICDEFEFLRKSSYKKMKDGSEGFRLKTIRLRGQVSQGLLLPLTMLDSTLYKGLITIVDGEDVTERLGITKYEPPIPAELSGKVKGLFPSFIRKTDEERVQNLTKEYEGWRLQSKHQFYVTEKLDGSSATFYYKDGVFGVCSRNLELSEPEPFVPGMVMCDDGIERPKTENTFWKVARELDLENKLRSYGKNLSIQGELIGEGIQGNPYKIKGQTVRFFNIFDIDNQTYYGLPMFMATMEHTFGLETVPVLDTNFILPNDVSELLSYADAKSTLNPNFDREGVVIRSLDRTISFKVISNTFLLKHEK